MTRREFLDALKARLAQLPKGEIERHLAYYEEIIDDMLEVSASSGRVWLRLPENAGFTLRYDTASGELSCGFAAVIDGEGYVVGDGAGAFHIETASGNLDIAVLEVEGAS